MTDHGTMAGFAPAFLHVKELNSKGANFKFVGGCEMYLHSDIDQWRKDYAEYQEQKKSKTNRSAKTTDDDEELETDAVVENEERSRKSRSANPLNRRHHLVVLPKSRLGLSNLFNLITLSYRDDNYYYYPRIDFKMLKELGQDLIVSSACTAGILSYNVLSSFPDVEWDKLDASLLDEKASMEAVVGLVGNSVDRLVDCVGKDNVLLEVQFNGMPQQHLVNRAIMEFAKRSGMPLVATADSHYPRPELWKAREIYKKLAWMDHEKIDPEMLPKSEDDVLCRLYPKNAVQMWDEYKRTTQGLEFYDDKTVCDAIERSHDVVYGMIGDVEPDVSVKLPSYIVPEGRTAIKVLYEFCRDEMIKRGLVDKPEYVERLKKELDLIKKKEFEKYFLMIKEIIAIARTCTIVGPGRGSSCGSLVLYLLNVTQVDPIKHNIIFERFLSESREGSPDVDTDVSDRDALFEALQKRFGELNVLYISNFNTLKLKSLIKDVSKFFGIDFDEVNAVTKVVESQVKAATQKAGDDKNLFELKFDDAMEHSAPFKAFMDKYPQVCDNVQQLHKQNRSIGRHAGGILALENPERIMPVIRVRGHYQSPWVEGLTLKTLEGVGFLKFDLLGLDTLRIIQRCITYILEKQGNTSPTFDQVRDWYDANLHPDKLDLHDQIVYKNVYHDGRWPAIFQFTSSGSQSLIQKFKPTNVVDIATSTSIYRPGPLNAHVDELYLETRNDSSKIKYKHPLILDVLSPTAGCIIFQEQCMQLAHKVGGFTLNEADKVRKAVMKRTMTGKDAAAIKQKDLGEKFVKGAMKNGLTKEESDEIWADIIMFSGYGFNFSHAFSYALDSYMCAWLFTYYPDEWLCAWLESAQVNPDERAKAISEVRRYGYKVVPIDVNEAKTGWTSLPGKRLMGSFMSLKSVGSVAIEEIMANRPYSDLIDLLWDAQGNWRHSKANKKVWDVLTKLGAFDSMRLVGKDCLFSNYRQLNYILVECADRLKKKNGVSALKDVIDEALKLEDWSDTEKAQFHQELAGDMDVNMLVSEEVQQKLLGHGVVQISELKGKGLAWFVLEDFREKLTKNGKGYLLLTAKDSTGSSCRIFLWGGRSCSYIKKNAVYIAEAEKTDFGYSSRMGKLKMIE